MLGFSNNSFSNNDIPIFSAILLPFWLGSRAAIIKFTT